MLKRNFQKNENTESNKIKFFNKRSKSKLIPKRQTFKKKRIKRGRRTKFLV